MAEIMFFLSGPRQKYQSATAVALAPTLHECVRVVATDSGACRVPTGIKGGSLKGYLVNLSAFGDGRPMQLLLPGLCQPVLGFMFCLCVLDFDGGKFDLEFEESVPVRCSCWESGIIRRMYREW